jgi:hypothetical protein
MKLVAGKTTQLWKIQAMFESLGKLCEGKEPANGSASESTTKKEEIMTIKYQRPCH